MRFSGLCIFALWKPGIKIAMQVLYQLFGYAVPQRRREEADQEELAAAYKEGCHPLPHVEAADLDAHTAPSLSANRFKLKCCHNTSCRSHHRI